jgi:hypothetical protein
VRNAGLVVAEGSRAARAWVTRREVCLDKVVVRARALASRNGVISYNAAKNATVRVLGTRVKAVKSRLSFALATRMQFAAGVQSSRMRALI